MNASAPRARVALLGLPLLLLVPALSSCSTDLQLDAEGYRCDAGDSCPAGLACVEGRCVSRAAECTEGTTCEPSPTPTACEGVDCSHAPSATCLDVQTLRLYAETGSCLSSTSSCDYAYLDTTCSQGCLEGKCVGEPCAGIACITPPAPACLDAGTLRTHAQTGTCSPTTGECGYVSTEIVCLNGCVNGACVDQDLCAGKSCNSPPGAQCIPGAVRTYGSVGTCASVTGQCAYTFTETPCTSCQAGTCSLTFQQTLPRVRSAVSALDQAPGSQGKHVLAVGPLGYVSKWNGSSWTQLSSGTTQTLRAVWMASPTLGWIVGANATVLRYDGTSITPVAVPLPPNADLVSVHGVGTSHAIAVTVGGQYVRFDGQSWTSGQLPPANAPYRIRGVYVDGQGRESITGGCATGGAACTARGCGCVAQSAGVTGAFVVRVDAMTANPFTAIGPSLEPEGQGYTLVGRDTNARRVDASGTFDDVNSPAGLQGQRLVGISRSAHPAGQAVYLLTTAVPGISGLLTRWTNDAAGLQEEPPYLAFEGDHQAMSRNDSNGVIVTDSHRTTANLFRAGAGVFEVLDLAESWRAVSFAPSGDLQLMSPFGDVAIRKSSGELQLHGASGSVGVARDLAAGAALSLLVGDFGGVYRFEGGTFSTALPGSGSEHLLAVCRVSDTEWYAVGEAGRAYRSDGTSLTVLATPAGTGALNDVDCIGPGEAVAVGASGAVLRLSGNGFTPVTATPPTTTALLSVAAGADGSLYVSGNGVFFRFSNGAWSSLPGASLLHSLAVLGPNEVYGASGDELLRFNGSGWTLVTKATAAFTRADVSGRRLAYVGTDGVLLEGR